LGSTSDPGKEGQTDNFTNRKVKGLLPSVQDGRIQFSYYALFNPRFLMAIIPGVSAIIPTFVVYSLEKKISKHPEKFGTGVIEGVAAPESANNAAATGTLFRYLV